MAGFVLPSSEVWREEQPRGGWWSRLTRGFRKLLWRDDWEGCLGSDWPRHVFGAPITDNYSAKQGRSVGRLILYDGPRRLAVYLKRHYHLSRWAGLLATVFPRAAWSPGWQEARHLRWAKELGIPVPEVVAAGEFVHSGGKLQSFLAVEELADMLPLHQAVPLAKARLDGHGFAQWKRGLAQEMARLSRLLHDRRFFHKDLYLCHFYVPAEDCERIPVWPGRVHMIDFHRLARHPWTWRWWRLKDLGQLLYSSWVDGVTARDRLRFWKAYLGEGKRNPLLAWLVRLRGGLYRRKSGR